MFLIWQTLFILQCVEIKFRQNPLLECKIEYFKMKVCFDKNSFQLDFKGKFV